MSEPRVFVIDDDPSVRKALERLIRSAHMDVQAFASAEEFLSADLPLPDCLIVDVRMPGMSGLELQQQLLAGQHHVPLIFISAHEDEQVRRSALAAGAVDILEKPFGDDVLLELLSKAVA